MTRSLFLVVAGILALSTGAGQAQKGESVMFGSETPSLKPGDDERARKAALCEEMRKEVDELKGRPQQRSAAMARFEAQCRDAPGAVPVRPSRP